MTIYADLSTAGNGSIASRRSFLNQLIDVPQTDISASISRRKYQVFVTGGIGPGVTSSLFQTVYDNDFTLQSANPMFDITVGIAPPTVITNGIADKAKSSAPDTYGKYLYPSSSLMMREKTDIYSQFAQILLGDRNQTFSLPVDANNVLANQNEDKIDAAMFMAFKRLFARDQIKRETFAMRFYQTASFVSKTGNTDAQLSYPPSLDQDGVQNIAGNDYSSGSVIYTDVGGGEASRYFAQGGMFSYLVDAAATSRAVGLMFYDAGVAVFDLAKVTSGSQFMSGTISAMREPNGTTVLGGPGTETYKTSKFIPDFLVSASIDNIVDHICTARFGGQSNIPGQTAITFQNVTNINSSLIFCRATPDLFNYSSNPTYYDSTGVLSINDTRVPSDLQDAFSYVTTIGLYDSEDVLVAVAKLSRPVEKNSSRDLTFRVRLDF